MKLLGIDYGRKQVGLAYSEGELATGLGSVARAESLRRITQVLKEHNITQCIVGVTNSRMTGEIYRFGQELKELTGCNVIYWDETLTTYQAQQNLVASHKSRKRRRVQEHEVAAALLLESYLAKNKDER